MAAIGLPAIHDQTVKYGRSSTPRFPCGGVGFRGIGLNV
jgi:hypothetical protein